MLLLSLSASKWFISHSVRHTHRLRASTSTITSTCTASSGCSSSSRQMMLLRGCNKSCSMSKSRNIKISRFYRTEAPVFGFCPSTKKAMNILNQSSKDNFKISHEGLNKDATLIRCMVNAYREHGHLVSSVNPLGNTNTDNISKTVLNPEVFSLTASDPVTKVFPMSSELLSDDVQTVGDLAEKLRVLYCQNMTLEVAHMMDPVEQEWFCQEYERISLTSLDPENRKSSAVLMKQAMVFEKFMELKFATTKRYGGEGCDAMMALLNQIFCEAAHGGVEEIVMAMPHRGRLNLLTGLLKYPPVQMFQKIRGMREWPDTVRGAGDVLSHLSNSYTVEYPHGSVYVTMIPNPSHLEASNPVAVGKTRAKQRMTDDGDYCHNSDRALSHKVLCLQIHGDAAFSAQGVIQETLALEAVPHYSVGGSVHVIVNNQLGFTTEAERGRTSRYSSCVSKMNSVPILRVNGEDPDAVMKAAMIAMSYRNAWQKDVIIDMLCYRRLGHNEVDDPSFTQPLMYKKIDSLPPVPDVYAKRLVGEGICTAEEITEAEKQWRLYLDAQFGAVETTTPKADHLEKQWSGMVQPADEITCWDTGVSKDLLRYVATQSVSLPSDFNPHPTLLRSHIRRRLQKVEENSPVDWATAEAMAFGSLIAQGIDVRISGQDVGRGTFSHRHVMLVDQDTDAIYVPLNHMSKDQTNFLEVCNSILSEEAVLGFEYGFSIESPQCLPIWEAQFGDFFNGAQIMIDTYVSSGEAKWLRQSGLVMMLPTGMDGAGPEHSSCRLERFLQLTDSKENQVDGDSVNMSVVYPTTPAQYFHLLRRQMVRNFRKPLIMAAPKVLLRLAAASSSLSEMDVGTSFRPVLDDLTVDKASVKKIIFCSGKHFYTLEMERQARSIKDTAIVRLEELCPFPAQALQAITQSYPLVQQFTWAQEEPRNSGSWSFVQPRFESLIGVKLEYAGRRELATPATGIGLVYKEECASIIESAFATS